MAKSTQTPPTGESRIVECLFFNIFLHLSDRILNAGYDQSYIGDMCFVPLSGSKGEIINKGEEGFSETAADLSDRKQSRPTGPPGKQQSSRNLRK